MCPLLGWYHVHGMRRRLLQRITHTGVKQLPDVNRCTLRTTSIRTNPPNFGAGTIHRISVRVLMSLIMQLASRCKDIQSANCFFIGFLQHFLVVYTYIHWRAVVAPNPGLFCCKWADSRAVIVFTSPTCTTRSALLDFCNIRLQMLMRCRSFPAFGHLFTVNSFAHSIDVINK